MIIIKDNMLEDKSMSADNGDISNRGYDKTGKIDKPQTIKWKDRGWYLVLEFERSQSPLFQSAVNIARRHPNYSEIADEKGSIVYRNIYRADDIKMFPELYYTVKNWKKVRTFIMGDEYPPESIIDTGIGCYLNELNSFHRSCNISSSWFDGIPNYIGCYQSRVALNPEGWKTWFSFGEIDDRGNYFIVDKKEIKKTVINGLHRVRHCPIVNYEKALKIVSALPEKIDLSKEPRWIYHYSKTIYPHSFNKYKEFLKKLLKDVINS